jgi:hypothetical protein
MRWRRFAGSLATDAANYGRLTLIASGGIAAARHKLGQPSGTRSARPFGCLK